MVPKLKDELMQDTNALQFFPLNKGDNFRLGPYHFVCMGWKNGRILATRYERGLGIIKHSLSFEVVLDQGFKILTRSTGN